MVKWLGIRWSFHPLFVLVMIASLATGFFSELLTLFLIVLVHEAGHVITARAFGWTVREVKLLPFGGVVEVDEASGLPAGQEAMVAIAGPLQNLWIGLAAWGCGQLGWWDAEWAAYVWKANMMIGLFNLLPIYPLDGGKLLQAAFSYGFNYFTMMKWTARISIALSAMMIIFSILIAFRPNEGVQLNLLAIGIFLLLTNWTYYRNIPYLFVRFLMHRDRVAARAAARGAYARPLFVSGKQPIGSVMRLLWREQYHLVYVMEPGGQGARVVPEERLIDRYLTERDPHRAVMELI
ncbi:M50 family metallopeptidase [Paenibacillus gorillae]|uniref:M50 family metallopeptidase n=1 Tax=Paenibacillus gorillae TaxID=1243662 RepID=UPI0004AE9637|nr:M50 family metallopeptidase [Paenibacillus gorillae]